MIIKANGYDIAVVKRYIRFWPSTGVVYTRINDEWQPEIAPGLPVYVSPRYYEVIVRAHQLVEKGDYYFNFRAYGSIKDPNSPQAKLQAFISRIPRQFVQQKKFTFLSRKMLASGERAKHIDPTEPHSYRFAHVEQPEEELFVPYKASYPIVHELYLASILQYVTSITVQTKRRDGTLVDIGLSIAVIDPEDGAIISHVLSKRHTVTAETTYVVSMDAAGAMLFPSAKRGEKGISSNIHRLGRDTLRLAYLAALSSVSSVSTEEDERRIHLAYANVLIRKAYDCVAKGECRQTDINPSIVKFTLAVLTRLIAEGKYSSEHYEAMVEYIKNGPRYTGRRKDIKPVPLPEPPHIPTVIRRRKE